MSSLFEHHGRLFQNNIATIISIWLLPFGSGYIQTATSEPKRRWMHALRPGNSEPAFENVHSLDAACFYVPWISKGQTFKRDRYIRLCFRMQAFVFKLSFSG
jgi:hypothetical protein